MDSSPEFKKSSASMFEIGDIDQVTFGRKHVLKKSSISIIKE